MNKKNNNPSSPRVIFNNKELAFTIGEWLGTIPSKNTIDSLRYKFFSLFDKKTLIKYGISQKTIDDTSNAFNKMLIQMGIKNEKSIISIDRNNTNLTKEEANYFLSLICNSPKNHYLIINIVNKLREFGDPNIVIGREDNYHVYYFKDEKDLELGVATQVVKKNNRDCTRTPLICGVRYDLVNHDNDISIGIEMNYPDDDILDFENDDSKFKNNDEIIDYLLNIEDTKDVVNIYNDIYEITKVSKDKCRFYYIEITEGPSRNRRGLLFYSGNKLVKYINKIGNTKICIKGDGSWSYESRSKTVKRDKNGQYSIYNIPLNLPVNEEIINVERVVNGEKEYVYELK